MRIFTTTNKPKGLILFFLFLVQCMGLYAGDANCPSLSKKTLELCNPERDEVARNLGAPIAIVNGERAVGYLETLSQEFYYTKNDKEYSAYWTFKNADGTTLASGCEQKFSLVDNEAPTPGNSTLTVYGYGGYLFKNMDKETLKRQIENQSVTWSDNCTTSDSIEATFDFKNIKNSTYNNGESVDVDVTLTDKSGNSTSYTQTINIVVDKSKTCPYLKDIVISGCDLKCTDFQNKVKVQLNQNNLVMDGFASELYPKKSGDYYNLYNDSKGSYNCEGNSTVHLGEHTVYLYYYQKVTGVTLIDKVCPQKVIVKDMGTPPACPELNTIAVDASTISASEIETKIKQQVNNYGTQLDNCSSNSNLLVTYTGGSLSAPYCGEITYALSDYGTKRTCKANIAVPECPALPELTAKYCDWNDKPINKQTLCSIIDKNIPSLDFCGNTVTGSYDKKDINSTYNSGESIVINWTFTTGNIQKVCPQTAKVVGDTSASCVAKDVQLEVGDNCTASGDNVSLPTVNTCKSYAIKWRTQNDYDHTRREVAELSQTTFNNGDKIIWTVNYGDAQCISNVTVSDHTKPTCSTPSLGKLSGKNSYSQSEVTPLFEALSKDALGTDNCGIKGGEIDWTHTAFTTFTPNADGSAKAYNIYYKVRDNSDNENDGYCVATLNVEGIPAPKCPNATIYALSKDGSLPIALDGAGEWKVKSPSTVSLVGGQLSGLNFGTENDVQFEVKWNTSSTKTCDVSIKLIKSVTPCSEIKSNITTYKVGDVEFNMIKISAGSFYMGAQSSNSKGINYCKTSMNIDREGPVHLVNLTQDYHMAETECTQALWVAVMGSGSASEKKWTAVHGKGDNYPVYSCSIKEIDQFFKKLNELLADKIPAGYEFGLPTSAQHEYATRACEKEIENWWPGTNNKSEVPNYVWYGKSLANEGACMVKALLPNALGLYGMCGGIYEWTSDCTKTEGDAEYTADEVTDPHYECDDITYKFRIARGGTYNSGWSSAISQDFVRVTYYDSKYNSQTENRGFRIALIKKS